jgi:hypothetical protein
MEFSIRHAQIDDVPADENGAGSMGYEATIRFDQPVPDGTAIPLAHMKKDLQ